MKLYFFANSVTQSKDIQVLLHSYQFTFFHHAILQRQRLFQKCVVCTNLDIYVFNNRNYSAILATLQINRNYSAILAILQITSYGLGV